MIALIVFIIIFALFAGFFVYLVASEDIKCYVFPPCVKCKRSKNTGRSLMCYKVVDEIYGHPSHCGHSRGCYKCWFAKAKNDKSDEESEM